MHNDTWERHESRMAWDADTEHDRALRADEARDNAIEEERERRPWL